MFNLDTVESLVGDARDILLDEVPPYRYSDNDLVKALNIALLEARRLRPDMFCYKWHNTVPQYTAVNGEKVPIDPQYRLAISYGIVAHAMLRDEEDIPTERSNSFMRSFQGMLTGVMISPVAPARPSQ